MAYETGTVNTLADLLTALLTACTDNGWTLSGTVLHKGAAYISASIVLGRIRWTGGTGIDGSNNLTGGGPYAHTDRVGAQVLTYPMVWEAHIFTDPDEVYFVMRFNTDFYEMVGFGLSTVAGLLGTGMWFSATRAMQVDFNLGFYCDTTGASIVNQSATGLPMFAAYDINQPANYNNSFIHHGLDGGTWSGHVTADSASSARTLVPLYGALPNQWNNEVVLLPFQVYWKRSSGAKLSLVADLRFIRHVRIDYLNPGDIVTFGGDSWKVYPWYRKDASNRNGGAGVEHSGTFGFAVRFGGS